MHFLLRMGVISIALACSHTQENTSSQTNTVSKDSDKLKHFYVISFVDSPMQGNQPSRKAFWSESQRDCIASRSKTLNEISKQDPEQTVTVSGFFYDKQYNLKNLQSSPDFLKEYAEEDFVLDQHERIEIVSGCASKSGSVQQVFRDFISDL